MLGIIYDRTLGNLMWCVVWCKAQSEEVCKLINSCNRDLKWLTVQCHLSKACCYCLCVLRVNMGQPVYLEGQKNRKGVRHKLIFAFLTFSRHANDAMLRKQWVKFGNVLAHRHVMTPESWCRKHWFQPGIVASKQCYKRGVLKLESEGAVIILQRY